MAGDWLQIDLDLPEKPEVLTVTELTRASHVDVVIGRIVLLWRWVERHATCASVRGTGIQTLVRLCGGDEEFWRAVESVGWVQFTDEGIVIPGWQKRFSQSAKRRIMAAKQARKRRSGVARASRERVTPALPKEEKSKEDLSKGAGPLKPRGKKSQNDRPPVTSADVTIPSSIDTPEVRAAVDEWLAFKRTNRETYKKSDFLARKLKEFARDPPEAFVAAVHHSIGNNYSGLVRPKHEERPLFDRAGARAGYNPDAKGDI